MVIHIIYTHYLDLKGESLSIGGIQTYLTNLSQMLVEEGYKVDIFQVANSNFIKNVKGITVYGIDCKLHEARRILVKECKKSLSYNDIIIFGTDLLATSVNVPSIAIQHGISWDVPLKEGIYNLNYLKKCIKAWKRIKVLQYANKLVCVDYNFINWIRAIVPYCKSEMIAIPNFTRIPEKEVQKHDSKTINIIFARRFFEYRGTKVFANVIEKVINERSNVFVTFAGEGEDEAYLKNRFKKYENVTFIKYNADESLLIHKDQHIAVVPTIGSEGTSLSLLEAMASGCAVIATDVGGMTNIIIDEYNGLMVSAGNEQKLYEAVLALIDDQTKRKYLADNGYNTVKNAFSYEKWKLHWKEVIESFEIVGFSRITRLKRK